MISRSLPLSLTRRALMAAMPAAFLPRPGLGQEARPSAWASRVLPEVPGLPNLHRVTPLFYRAAQPDEGGFHQARALGIRTVISMRQTVRDADLVGESGLVVIQVPMKTRHVAERDGEKVVAVLRALRASMAAGPVLVHCHHGADRTGLICALFRMIEQDWPREEAIAEMTQGGFGFHPVWANIPRYLRRVDLDDLRERVLA